MMSGARAASVARARPGESDNPHGADEAHGTNRGPSSALTATELDRLFHDYAEQRQPGSGTDVPTLANDTRNGQKLADGAARDLTGYPREIARFEQRHAGLLDQLAALPPSQSRFYAAGAATFASAYRMATPDGRADIDREFGQLENAVRDEYNRAVNDPLERVLGVFNTPVGAGYLDRAGQNRIGQLSRMRRRFLAAATPEQRASVYRSALSFKKNLQSQISGAIDTYGRRQAADWKAANDDVDRMLGEAERVDDDPGKRYELIARQLHTSNPGSGEDPFEEKRILAFTERMQDDPAVRDKLAQWGFDAGKKLNSFGVGGPKRYADIVNDPPAAGPEYVRELADRYDAVLRDATTKDQSITPQERAKHVAAQILEGTARFVLGMTPFAPLSTVFDAHSSLPPNARIGVDVAANVLGTLLDPASAASGAIAESKAFADAIAAIDTAADPGHGAATVLAAAASKRPLAPVSTVGYAGSLDSAPAHPLTVPAAYASHAPLDSLKASAEASAILEDASGQNFVAIGGRAYPARYDKSSGTARVYDADNLWNPSYSARLNSKREWEIVDVGPLRLRGGGGAAEAGPSSSPPMSQELKTALQAEDWRSPANAYLDDPAYRQRYQAAFDNLSADQKTALRRWTALDERASSENGNDSDSGSDSNHSSDTDSDSIGSRSTAGLNFDLNHDLRAGDPSAAMIKARDDLAGALERLPAPATQDVRLLRVADVPADYASRFKPGDLVTDKGFMAASSDRQYALDSIADDGAVGGSEQPAMAFYAIQSRSAKPFIAGIDTDASNESEWLMRPGTVFRVDEIATLVPADTELKPRIGLRLTEVPVTAPIDAKDIYTGQAVHVSPGGRITDEPPAGPPAKKQKTGSPRPR
ncbi:hypothetical protein BTO02_11935 [Paraburkholderia sp. SOS3]|nr:hypothetical protein BTO02_11935 [Paraburkholderia sp. SOS3]